MLIVLFCGSGCNSTSSAQTQLATSSINSARAPELSSEGQIWLRAAISSGSFPDLRWPDLSDYSPHVKKFYEHNRKAVRLSARRTPRHTRSKILVPERYRGSYLQHRKGFGNSPRLCPIGPGHELYCRRQHGMEFPVDTSVSPFHSPEHWSSVRFGTPCSERRWSATYVRARIDVPPGRQSTPSRSRFSVTSACMHDHCAVFSVCIQ